VPTPLRCVGSGADGWGLAQDSFGRAPRELALDGKYVLHLLVEEDRPERGGLEASLEGFGLLLDGNMQIVRTFGAASAPAWGMRLRNFSHGRRKRDDSGVVTTTCYLLEVQPEELPEGVFALAIGVRRVGGAVVQGPGSIGEMVLTGMRKVRGKASRGLRLSLHRIPLKRIDQGQVRRPLLWATQPGPVAYATFVAGTDTGLARSE
jgi:hypothetical protein